MCVSDLSQRLGSLAGTSARTVKFSACELNGRDVSEKHGILLHRRAW